MNLPWDDRVVDIFTYIMTFTPEQKTAYKILMQLDKGQTTDKNIFDIASRKQTLANGLFEIVQTGAVDCELHYHEHGMATQCYHFNKHHFARGDAGRLFTYHPNWVQDVREAPVGGGIGPVSNSAASGAPATGAGGPATGGF
jgi:hypothetical protein